MSTQYYNQKYLKWRDPSTEKRRIERMSPGKGMHWILNERHDEETGLTFHRGENT